MQWEVKERLKESGIPSVAWHACGAEKTAIYIQAPTEQLFHENIDSSSTRAQAKRLIKRLRLAYRDL